MIRLLFAVPLAFRLYNRSVADLITNPCLGLPVYVPAVGIWADACVRAWQIAGRL